MSNNGRFTVGRLASLACLLEVCAAKPGNVHRGADFEDVGLVDFIVSAEILGQVIDQSECRPAGEIILDIVGRTRQQVQSNTNLGLALLLVPLACSFRETEHLDVPTLLAWLEQLGPDDSQAVYQAIRLANPGGLRQVDQMDINQEPPRHLRLAMSRASDYDLVARQYANGFEEVFSVVLPLLLTGQTLFASLTEAIVFTHVNLLARFGDSLIHRKCGQSASDQAASLARRAVDALRQDQKNYWQKVGDLDFWLRADGHRRNPGTTADLVAAGLFCGLALEQLESPWK